MTTCNTGHVRAARGWVRSRGVLPRMRTRHQTRVASVSCFMTVAGHVASKFDVVHDIDLLDKRAGSWSPLCPAHTCFRTRMCLCLMRTRAWWMDLASPSLNTCNKTNQVEGIDKLYNIEIILHWSIFDLVERRQRKKMK